MFTSLFKSTLWIVWIVLFVLLLFLRGYLLTKIEIEKVSLCSDYQTATHTKSCWSTPRYKKAVLVLIDALRHDFTVYNSSVRPEDVKPWQNKMPIFSHLVKEQPRKAKHMEFIADPPTATFLRLKGLTTGGLPTFVDLGSNFGSSEIAEDSWVQQLSLNKKNLVFMGDDTWVRIYNKYFHRSYPYPSFDVWDLHTVDNGVWKHILPEMEHQKDWDVIVGHFLGVDHAGHRYHVNHPELSAKLTQLNEWVTKIVQSVDNDTILFIFGDHGMTTSGDHGGETKDEITSSLFIYSGTEFGEMASVESDVFLPKRVYQTDLVPTLTMLLGVPIPYSSLGNIIPFLFLTSDAEQSRLALQHNMHTNMNQVFRYIEAYSMISAEFTDSDILLIKSELDALNEEFGKSSNFSLFLFTKMQGLVNKIRRLCSEHWAQFNLPLMMFAVVAIFILSVVLVILAQTTFALSGYVFVPSLAVALIGYDSLSLWVGVTHPITVIVTIATLSIGIYTPIKSQLKYLVNRKIIIQRFVKCQFPDILSVFLIVLISIGFTTNSYILVEDYVTIFFFGTLCLSITLQRLIKHRFKLTYGLKIEVLVTLTTLLMSRMSSIFYGCREEQFWCTKTWWLNEDIDESHKNTRYMCSVLCLSGTVFILYYYQKYQGSLVNRLNCIKFIHCTLQPLQCILVAVYWALSSVPAHILSDKELCYFPLAVYFITLLSISLVLFNPSSIYIELNKKQTTPKVYGLACCYTSPSLTIYSALIPTSALLLGLKLSPVLLLLTVQLLCVAHIARDSSMLTRITLLHLLYLQYFFATGHQAAVQQFDWNAAFVGFTSHSNNVVPAVMIVARTLMSIILVAVFSPLVVLNSSDVPTQKERQIEISSNSQKHIGELKYFLDKVQLADKMHSYIYLSASLVLFKCLWACIACYLHRRHLMIWNIFTPRAVIEMCFAQSYMTVLIFVILVISRTDKKLGDIFDNLKLFKVL